MITLLALITIESVFPTLLIVVGEIVVAIISGYCLFKVAQLKSHINSRMDELLKLTSDSAFAKGRLQGKADQTETP